MTEKLNGLKEEELFCVTYISSENSAPRRAYFAEVIESRTAEQSEIN